MKILLTSSLLRHHGCYQKTSKEGLRAFD